MRIVGQLGISSGNNLGRNDQIHVDDAGGNLVDRLRFGDPTYPGTIRTQNASGKAPCGPLGRNDVALWQLSGLGDAYGSTASTGGDLGTPGRYDCTGRAGGGVDPVFSSGFEPAMP